MSTASALNQEIEIFRHNVRTTDFVVRANIAGLTTADSLVQPRPAGNCLNWILGHLICIYNNVLPLLNQNSYMDPSVLKRYDRGAKPIRLSTEALPMEDLVQAWTECNNRVEAGLASLSTEALDSKAKFSPTNNPDETLRTLLATVFFHQAYHAGQLGVLRRIANKPGAIA